MEKRSSIDDGYRDGGTIEAARRALAYQTSVEVRQLRLDDGATAREIDESTAPFIKFFELIIHQQELIQENRKPELRKVERDIEQQLNDMGLATIPIEPEGEYFWSLINMMRDADDDRE